MQPGLRRGRSPSSEDSLEGPPKRHRREDPIATAPHISPVLAVSPPSAIPSPSSSITLQPTGVVTSMGRISNGTTNGFNGVATDEATPHPSTSSAAGYETNGESSRVRAPIIRVQPEGDLMYEDDRDWSEYQENGIQDGSAMDVEDGEGGHRTLSGQKGALAGTKRMPVNREEVTRLMLQALRDIGYNQAAESLEAESGFTLASQSALDFQAAILGGRWSEAIGLLPHLDIPMIKSSSTSTMAAVAEEPDTSSASSIRSGKSRHIGLSNSSQSAADSIRFLVSQQKYLELLEIGSQKKALAVLRTELAPVAKDSEVLHTLSGGMVQKEHPGGDYWSNCKIMVPSRRLATLLDQARRLQQQSCLYHTDPEPFSLYTDHECASGQFPSVTTHILADHTDEVFNLAWSPDGNLLATAGQDKVVVIWKLTSSPRNDGTASYSIAPLHHLKDHGAPVAAMAWSPDGKTLVTAADRSLYIWDTERNTPSGTSQHSDEISAIRWIPDGSEFLVSSMDCKLIFYSAAGEMRKQWSSPSLQFRDFVITPDGQRIVASTTHIRRHLDNQKPRPSMSGRPAHDPINGIVGTIVEDFGYEVMEHGVMVVRLSDKEILDTLPGVPGEITSVTLSADGKRFLINVEDEDVRLYSIDPHIRLVRKYSGHVQHRFLIRSSFGAPKDRFILSGSEDGHVYVWQANSSTPIEVLQGHGASVNAVSWNPVLTRRLFASCSDDMTVRIWQPPVSAEIGLDSGVSAIAAGETGGSDGMAGGLEL